jgi:murein DD-endopeptidase MepM/ murein hydrolase activator NlpD
MLVSPTRTDRVGLRFLEWYAPHRVYHSGVDYNWGPLPDSDKGQPVVSPASGTVVYVSPKGTNGGLGNYLVIEHPQFAAWTRYLHLDEVIVRKGQRVTQGQPVATLGDSGTSSSHLHLEVLNAKGLAYIRDHHRPYGRYPSGLPKQTVAALFLDPVLWLRGHTEPASSRRDARRDARLKRVV